MSLEFNTNFSTTKETFAADFRTNSQVNGASAYEIAVENGYEGTEEEWIESLKGEQGIQGIQGEQGLSAYEVAVENGFEGTEAEWIESLFGTIVQATGESATAVMSQAAVTRITAPLVDQCKTVDLSESNKHTQGYITANGTAAGFIIASGSWQSYLLYPIYDKIEFTCYSNDINGIFAAAFYSVTETPSEKSFISGIKIPTADANAEQKYSITITKDMIPEGTKSIVLCSRTATGNDTALFGYTLIPSEFSRLLKAEKGCGNVKAVFKSIPNTNDFTIVKDEIWFAENIYQDGVATEFTTVHRYRIEDGELVHISDIDTDFGHWNCVDYNEENDCLVFGNAANAETTEGNFFSVVKNPLGLGAIARLETCGIKYPVDIGYKVQAVWGDSNWGKHNIVYLMSNNGRKFVNVLLLKNANGDFNGNYVTLETHETETDLWIGGADFWGDTLYVGGGAYYISEVSMTDYSMKRIWKHFYKDDGTEYSGSTQGVHIDSKYIWVFSNVGGSSENYLVQYYR